jgi:hypothetical protein
MIETKVVEKAVERSIERWVEPEHMRETRVIHKTLERDAAGRAFKLIEHHFEPEPAPPGPADPLPEPLPPAASYVVAEHAARLWPSLEAALARPEVLALRAPQVTVVAPAWATADLAQQLREDLLERVLLCPLWGKGKAAWEAVDLRVQAPRRSPAPAAPPKPAAVAPWDPCTGSWEPLTLGARLAARGFALGVADRGAAGHP